MTPTLKAEAPIAAWPLSWSSSSTGPMVSLVAKLTLALDPAVSPAGLVPAAVTIPRGESNPEDDEGDDGYPSDFVPYKPRAEVVVCGTTYPRAGRTTGRVVFRFGSARHGIERDIAVIGARRWEGGVPSRPRPLGPVPMRYPYAFGGPGHPLNPVGVGHGGAGRPSGPLPSLEDPEQLVASPRDNPSPACLAAIPMTWAQRWRKLGTFDEAWRREGWPDLPRDFDPSFFQAAPRAQQVDRIRGDEPFEVTGMRPDVERTSGRLPGRIVRAFVVTGGTSEEVPLSLDTIVFDMDALEVSLLFRKALPAASLAHRRVAFVVDDVGAEALPVAQLEELLAPDPAPPASPAPDARTLELRRRLDDAGVPAIWFTPALRPRLPVPAVDEIEDQLARTPHAELAPLLTELRLEADQAQAKRRWAEQRLADDGSLEGADLRGADLSNLNLRGRSLAGADLTGARLTGCQLQRTDLSEARLAEADLTGAIAPEVILRGADLSKAIVVDAELTRADLSDADLSGAQAEGARLDQARGPRARFIETDLRRADLGGATFDGADFSQAQLDGANFAEAKLGEARFYDAEGAVVFDDADLGQARGNDARFAGSSFRRARAERSCWDGAGLTGADFRSAQLSGACLNGSVLANARFSAAVMREAKLRTADLTGANLVQADLLGATLEEACLRGADFTGANLAGAETWKADLADAKLGQAILHRTKLAEGV